MHINDRGHVTLEEGDRFVFEEQDKDNCFRIGHYLAGGNNEVRVYRHFSSIGPIITKADGTPLDTTVVDNHVVEYTDAMKAQRRIEAYALIGKTVPTN